MVLEKYNRNHEVLNLIVMWFSQKEMGRELGLMSPCEGWTYSFAAELFSRVSQGDERSTGPEPQIKGMGAEVRGRAPSCQEGVAL
jgi:hypothetical protein